MAINLATDSVDYFYQIKNFIMKTLIIYFITQSPLSLAKYEEIYSNQVCNGYSVFTGTVSRMNSTTAYDGYEDTWVEIVDAYGNKYGGKIYYRTPVESAYTPMVNNARLALITGITVKACINGNDIYALEIYKL